jgi:DNA polymerase-3 subunit alpha
MLLMLPEVIASLEDGRRRSVEGQIGFFDLAGVEDTEPKLPDAPEMPAEELLAMEKEVTGFYISGHPMAKYEKDAQRLRVQSTAELTAEDGDYADGASVRVLGIITSVKKKITKQNSTMAFLTVEDKSGSIETLVFPKTLSEAGAFLSEGKVVLIHGKVSVREDEDTKLVCDHIEPYVASAQQDEAPAVEKSKKRRGLFLRLPAENCPEKTAAEKFLRIFEGNTRLYYYYTDTKQYDPRPVECCVDVNEPLLGELRRILGDENVAFVP